MFSRQLCLIMWLKYCGPVQCDVPLIMNKTIRREMNQYSALSWWWFNTVHVGLGRLHVHGLRFNPMSGGVIQPKIINAHVCFEINFSDRKEGSTMSSII